MNNVIGGALLQLLIREKAGHCLLGNLVYYKTYYQIVRWILTMVDLQKCAACRLNRIAVYAIIKKISRFNGGEKMPPSKIYLEIRNWIFIIVFQFF